MSTTENQNTTLNIRCTGVPEHFNLPWRIIEEKNILKSQGISISWKDNPSGTGAMCQDLNNNEVDVAILLQEGAIKNIHEGMDAKMVSMYVDSPLIWGVHTSINSPLHHQNLKSPEFAISRYSSGSHIMAYCYGKDRGFQVNSDNFSIVQNLEGARVSLANNLDQIFLWEKFTTKPYVDNGEFKCIDEYPTPWAPFVVVVRQGFLAENEESIHLLLKEVQNQALQIKNNKNSIEVISKRYGILEEDAKTWFNAVKWTNEIGVAEIEINSTSEVLLELGIIDRIPQVSDLIHLFKPKEEQNSSIAPTFC